jgi:NAD(P) transhydrogenase
VDRVDHYDLIVIGSGPAGEKGAAQAAYFGKRVAVIEREPYPGGAGINTGTVPSKTLRETARYDAGLTQHARYGLDVHVKDGSPSRTSCTASRRSSARCGR